MHDQGESRPRREPHTEGTRAARVRRLRRRRATDRARLKTAGAIRLARTNLAELSLRWPTTSGLRGATLNSWDASKTPGRSTGGDAVAPATGMTPLGVGTGFGGSLRVPSQRCGTAALRPTLGLIAQANALDAFCEPFLARQPFNMARRAQGLRLAFGAMAGGLPQGVQVIGGRCREEACLDAAQAIEEQLGIVAPIEPPSDLISAAQAH